MVKTTRCSLGASSSGAVGHCKSDPEDGSKIKELMPSAEDHLFVFNTPEEAEMLSADDNIFDGVRSDGEGLVEIGLAGKEAVCGGDQTEDDDKMTGENGDMIAEDLGGENVIEGRDQAEADKMIEEKDFEDNDDIGGKGQKDANFVIKNQ